LSVETIFLSAYENLETKCTRPLAKSKSMHTMQMFQ